MKEYKILSIQQKKVVQRHTHAQGSSILGDIFSYILKRSQTNQVVVTFLLVLNERILFNLAT